MASEYAYTTISGIENLTGIDYSTVDSVRLSDTHVEAKITLAEKMVIAYLGVSSAETVTDGVELATIMITAKLLHANLIGLGYREFEQDGLDYVKMSITDILEHFLIETQDDFVESIPMSGANFYKPDLRFG